MDLKIKAAKARKSEQNVTLDNQGQAKFEVNFCARISIQFSSIDLSGSLEFKFNIKVQTIYRSLLIQLVILKKIFLKGLTKRKCQIKK